MHTTRLKRTLYITTALSVGLFAPIFAAPALADAATNANGGAVPMGARDAGQEQVAQADQGGVEQIEEVTVTARRVTERLQDVPISITVFNQAQLNSRDVYNASQLGNYTPSLSVDQRFGPDNSSFSIRGFTQEIRTAASVATYFADVVEPRGGGIGTTAGDGAGPGDYFDLQNVQILKGPQGTLFGRNTTGGAVLLVPNKPDDTLGGYVEASTGDYAMQRLQGVLNVPLTDKIRVRLGVDEQTRNGYEPNLSDIGPGSFGNVDYYALRASVDIDVTSDIENYTVASYSHSENHGLLNQLFACNPSAPFASLGPCNEAAEFHGKYYWDVDNDYPHPESLVAQWRAINTTTWTVSDNFTVKNVTSYAQFKSVLDESVMGDDFVIPPSYTLSVGGLGTFTIPTTLLYPQLVGKRWVFTNSNDLPGDYSNDQSTLTEELQFQGNFWNNRFTWQGGGYMEVSDPVEMSGSQSSNFSYCSNQGAVPPVCTDPLNLLLFGGVMAGAQNSRGEISYHNLAGYWQGTYAIFDQLKFTGGIRYTSDLTKGASENIVYDYPGSPPPNNPTPTESCANTNATLANNCFLSYTQHSHAPTWVADLDYTPFQNVMFYAKYARGYRQGSVDPFGPANFTSFKPERVDSYELGGKTSFEGPVPGTFDFAAFYNDFQHQQLQLGFESADQTNLAPSPTTTIVNAGKSRIDGAEVDTSLFPFGEDFRLDVDGTYLDTKLISANFPTNAEVQSLTGGEFTLAVPTTKVGGPLPLAPMWKTSITGSYMLPVDESLGKISFSAGFVYTAKQRTADPDNTPFADVKSSALVNLSANWQSIAGSPVSASFFMTNALDYKYETFIPGLWAYGFESRSLGEPRMWGVRLRYDFGG